MITQRYGVAPAGVKAPAGDARVGPRLLGGAARKRLDPSNRRVFAIDALRGFALLGMLFTHIVVWYVGATLPAGWEGDWGAASRAVLDVNGFLFIGKFYSLFAFLFGLSFHLQMRSMQRLERHFVARYVWRLALLGAIGLAHHALWRGDVLSVYALLGLLLLPTRKLGDRAVLALGLLLVLNAPIVLKEGVDLAIDAEGPPPMLRAAAEAPRYLAVIQGGSLAELVRDNWSALLSKFEFQLLSGRLFATFGFFLLGGYVGRRRWLEELEASRAVIREIWLWTARLLLGLLVALAAVGPLDDSLALGIEGNRWAVWCLDSLFRALHPGLAVFYLGSMTLLLGPAGGRKVLRPLATVGRMSLTAYLGQTLFGVGLFYSAGLGLFGRTSPATNALLALAIFAAHALFSRWWLQRYAQGPVEWLWRSLTFLELRPLRLERLRNP
jgi:uncharacterized protein